MFPEIFQKTSPAGRRLVSLQTVQLWPINPTATRGSERTRGSFGKSLLFAENSKGTSSARHPEIGAFRGKIKGGSL